MIHKCQMQHCDKDVQWVGYASQYGKKLWRTYIGVYCNKCKKQQELTNGYNWEKWVKLTNVITLKDLFVEHALFRDDYDRVRTYMCNKIRDQ